MPLTTISSLMKLLSPQLLKAYAYLDPGSGSFILQILIATLLGSAFLIKTYWKKIIAFFRGQSVKSNGTEPDNKEE
jgi:hypothetical protein